MQLYCWFVGDLYDDKHVMAVANTVDEAREYIISADVIGVNGGYDFNLNDICSHGNNKGYTWKDIINYEDPIVYDLTLGKILAFQHGTG